MVLGALRCMNNADFEKKKIIIITWSKNPKDEYFSRKALQ